MTEEQEGALMLIALSLLLAVLVILVGWALWEIIK